MYGGSAAAENLSPQTMVRLGREIKELVQSAPDGVTYVANDEDSMAEVFADMEGPAGTPYEGGVFRLKLVLGSDYPSAPPRGYFLTKIFHPNVAANGDICVNTLKKDWNSTVTLSHVFQVIRCLLIVPFPESSLNDEAGKLFMESYDEYKRRAKLMTAVHALRKDSKLDGDAAADGEQVEKKASKAKQSKKKALKRL